MKEIRTIITEYEKIDFAQRKAAIATVVKVKGSSYRSPGARMLITDDGRWVGSISGGCLEGDALRKARQVMQNRKAMTVTYDTREESNQNLGIGLGCNGVIDVLIEPVEANDNGVVGLFRGITKSDKTYGLATISRSANLTGEKVLVDEEFNILVGMEDAEVNALLIAELRSAFSRRVSQSNKLTYHDEEMEVFTEIIQPTISLMIFGGGFDARPVSQLAKTLGWEITVTDECVAHIAPVFFPAADKLSLCDRSFIDKDFNITSHTACVLMSHNYEYDRDVLKKVILTPTPYIGILGPKKRFDKMLMDFKVAGLELSGSDFDRIHSPIGLDIGAETPDEIAISIVAEIQGKLSRRSGGFLKYRQGPIHARDGANEQVFKQVYLTGDDQRKLGAG